MCKIEYFKSAQSQKFNKNVNLNVKETFFTLYVNDMAAFDWIKLLRLKEILTLPYLVVSSSPNLPLLFVIVFWGDKNRSSLRQMFFIVDVLKNFANITEKYQCWSLFLIKSQAWRHAKLLKRDSNTGALLWNSRNF